MGLQREVEKIELAIESVKTDLENAPTDDLEVMKGIIEDAVSDLDIILRKF